MTTFTMPAPPYTFDGPYGGCYANRQMCVDERHVYLMHSILCAWPFNHALEIGSYNGASSTAFVEAVSENNLRTATLCDLHPTDSLRAVVSANRQDALMVQISAAHSCEQLSHRFSFDFIFVDGNHDMESVKPEVEQLLIRRPLCVMAHDTNATDAGYPKAEGAKFLKETFQTLNGYQSIEDAEFRDGEETQRGMFLATSDPRLFEIASGLFAKWCPKETA